MKKLVTLLLVVSLILSGLSLPAFAADPAALDNQTSPYTFSADGSGTLTQSYQLTDNGYAYTDVTKVDVAWEITNVSVTFQQKKMVWDAENLKWTEDKSQAPSQNEGITVTPGSAVFTITNRSTVKVDAEVQFAPETQFAANATWSFNDGTAKEAFSTTLDTLVNSDRSVKEGDAPSCTVNASVTTDPSDFKNLTATAAAAFGTYTISIQSQAAGSSEKKEEQDTDMDKPYLTFTGDKAFTLSANNHNWDGTMQYATSAPDSANSWATWDGSEISADATSHKLYLRGKNTAMSIYEEETLKYTQLTLSGDATEVRCSGNIMTLLDYEDPDKASVTEYCFARLFRNCTKLVSAPSLPATELAASCYSSMFKGCTALTSAPKLPAETLSDNCYSEMFSGCTSLKVSTESGTLILTVPDDVPSGAADRMFADCTLSGSAKGTPEAEETYYFIP